ncbi:hypothetical protein VP01_2781g2 [Puccinia sorghi]|uniref:Uncharacterized protein n=1 Tax=Puccinia sorghi TaxID=27349 RepID=A0A0L6V3F1_9BASI|nr:hypothetical protein VP01_2781g2 [Puccinia sorghi]
MYTALFSNLQASLAKRRAQTVSAGKKNASKAPITSPQVTVTQPARKISIPTSSSKKTPVKQGAFSATPVSNTLYVHISLIAQGSIPKPPSKEKLRSFYQRFQSTKEIQSAIDKCPLLLAIDTGRKT